MLELNINGYGDDLTVNDLRIGDLSPSEHEKIELDKGGQNYSPLENVVVSKVKDSSTLIARKPDPNDVKKYVESELLDGLCCYSAVSQGQLNKTIVDYDQVVQTHALKTLEKSGYAKEIGIILKSVELSKSIKSNKTISFRALAQIASAVPKRVKFKSIEYNGVDQIVIEGSAFSDQDILKLISNLNNKRLISQASLASMTLPTGQQGSQQMKGFKIACILESA